MLRLEATLQLQQPPAAADQEADPQAADEQQSATACLAALAVQWAWQAKLPNQALQEEHWLQEDDAWDAAAAPDQAPPPLLLDLNDAGMTFQMLRGHSAAELAHAPASILPAPPKVRPGPAAILLWRMAH
jgi:hypothetical protein